MEPQTRDRSGIRILSLGGTLLQREEGGAMRVAVDPREVLPEDDDLEVIEIGRFLGVDVTFRQILETRDRALAAPRPAGVVIVAGTDGIEEIAFALDRMIEPVAPCVVTGAMRPADAPGYDGRANLLQAIAVARDPQAAGLGVLVAMNDQVHAARAVRKADSAGIDAFRSWPGPVAELRCGRPHWHVDALPTVSRIVDVDGDRLAALSIPVFPVTLQTHLPESWLDGLDGAVIAGLGTGTLPTELIDRLARWTDRLPIVIASRCPTGWNVEDALYRGSRDKYESRGFRLRGFEGLTPWQARIQLALELAARRRAGG